MEQIQSSLDQLRLKGLACLAAGAMAVGLSGCSFGGNESERTPADTATYVEADAYTGILGPYDYVDTSAITASIGYQSDAESRYTYLENIDPKTGKDTYDFPSNKTAPVLTVSLGKNNRLVYEDATPGLLSDESKILAATNANAPLLVAAMAAGRLNSIHFRMHAPDLYPGSPDLEPSDQMFSLPHDFSDKGKANIYYFLPADKRLDTEAMQTMIGHEANHAALEHSDKNLLTPEQRTTYEKACGVLRNSALEEVGRYTNAQYDMYDLWKDAPAKLKPAYATVIKALENGTYGELPTWDLSPSEVSKCYIQPPMTAVAKQADLQGTIKLYTEQLKSDKVRGVIADIQDEWNDAIETDTVYKYIKEATWLAYGEDNKNKGHPQDGVHEVSASSLNRLMHDAEAFGKDMANIAAEESGAVTDLLDLTTTMLRKKYPDAHDLHRAIDERRTVFNTAFGK